MIWRSDICSSADLGSDVTSRSRRDRPRHGLAAAAAVLLAMCGAGQVLAATVTGQVRLVESRDSAVKRRNDFSGVVVWLSASEPFAPKIQRHAQMLQKDKKFSPHILVIETGMSVDFPNLDPIFHNAFSTFNGQIFDVSLYPPGSSRSVRFDRPGVVRIFCNIHPSMSAIIVVVSSPYFAETDRQGDYSFANVRPGKYQIHFFHERATPDTLERLTHDIVVGREGDQLDVDHLDLTTISEAGYLPLPHKNKYGRDYPPNSEDSGSYSSPLK